ncbi:MAG: hypothetical protein N3F66_01910 [Spirochaetes bacterium]|nr:hypothetical protein [Spirochaetota bacterium]
MLKRFFIFLTVLFAASVFFINPADACFDTFLFLHHKSMVYPTGYFAADVLGEYSFNDTNAPENDSYFTNYSMYYGLAERVSVQFGLTQAETTRAENKYSIESWSVRGVFNTIRAASGNYYMDLVAEHHTGVDIDENMAHFSIPNLFYVSSFIVVIHPVYELTYSKNEREHTFGGHGGVFYNINNIGIIGVGGEFASAQSSSALGKRFTEGEAAASLFIGFNLGNIYFQNEFAKGLNNSRDFGFAATLKFFFNLLSRY